MLCSYIIQPSIVGRLFHALDRRVLAEVLLNLTNTLKYSNINTRYIDSSWDKDI